MDNKEDATCVDAPVASLPSSTAALLRENNDTKKQNQNDGEKGLHNEKEGNNLKRECESGHILTKNDCRAANAKKPKASTLSESCSTFLDVEKTAETPAFMENSKGTIAITPPQSTMAPKVAAGGVVSLKIDPPPDKMKGSSLHDMCETLGLKAGDRIEVLWDITKEESEHREQDKEVSPGEKDKQNASSALDHIRSESKDVETRWWGATLLPPAEPLRYYLFDEVVDGSEGSDRERVPIRTLDYDPYVEGGFPEKSLNEVAFLSDKLVYDMGIKGSLMFRKAGSTWTPTREELDELHSESNADNALELDVVPAPAASATSTPKQSEGEGADGGNNEGEASVTLDGTKASVLPILDAVLAKALTNVQPRLASLTADRQLYVAEQIAKAKEKLADKLVEEFQTKGTRQITPSIIKMCMEEVGKELAALKGA